MCQNIFTYFRFITTAYAILIFLKLLLRILDKYFTEAHLSVNYKCLQITARESDILCFPSLMSVVIACIHTHTRTSVTYTFAMDARMQSAFNHEIISANNPIRTDVYTNVYIHIVFLLPLLYNLQYSLL